MTCRDCIHFKACYKMARANNADEFNTMYAEKCEDFSDRSAWVKLPCKVGDAVYQFDNAGRIYESVVTKIIYDTPIISFDKNAIGVSVFLSREEAKQALEERENGR